MHRLIAILICCVLAAPAGAETADSCLTTAILCDTPAGVVTTADRPVLRLQKGFSPQGLKWRLSDWRGRVMREGIWPESGILALDALPIGYYDIDCDFEDGHCLRRTSLTVLEPRTELLPSDSFFAIMTALPYCARETGGDFPWHGRDWLRVNADLTRLLGMPNAREIILWSLEQPQDDRPPAFTELESRAHDLLAARGIGIDAFNERAPEWADVKPGGKLPRNYKAVYDYYRWVAAKLGSRATSMEYWNEPEVDANTPEAAWEYVSSLKAAYLGMKAGNPQLPVLLGGFCTPPFTDYNRLVMANDAARYSDVFNYHAYVPVREIPTFVAGIRRNLAEAGIPDRAIWLTEMNTNQEGPALADSVRKGMKAQTRNQELIVAEHVAKSEIGYMMAGIARTFYFIMPCLNERNGTKDWGLSRRDGSMKPAYAALATLVRHVGRGRLEGRVDLGDARIAGYLFAMPDGSQTLAVWTVSTLDEGGDGMIRPEPDDRRTLELPADKAAGAAAFDMLGQRLDFERKGDLVRLEIGRFASYVSGLRGLSVRDRPVPAGRIERHGFPEGVDQTLIVRVDLDDRDFELGGKKTIAEMNGRTGHVSVSVWNLSDRAKHGCLRSRGGRFAGLPPAIDVPAWGCVTAETVLEANPPQAGESVTRVEIGGLFEGKKLTRFAMPVRCRSELMATADVVVPDLSQMKRWKRNDSARTGSIVWDEGERAVRIDVSWQSEDVNRWFFERYELALPTEDCDGAFAVEYEAKMTQDKIENDVNCAYLQIANATGLSYCPVLAPREGWERRTLTIEKGISRGISAFQFGCCPKGGRCTFWVRDLKVYRVSTQGKKEQEGEKHAKED